MPQRFSKNILPHVEHQLALAERAYADHQPELAFAHLENAHVLGQQSTWLHVKVHWLMLRWGWRQANMREVRGQILRIIGAATKTVWGLIPIGNTGGSNISPFKPLPLSEEHSRLIAEAKSNQ